MAGGPVGAPALIVAHANGFAAGSYAPWLTLLARDLCVFAFDARGPQGGFTLACPPAVESCIFRQHRLADTWQRLPAATANFHVVRGDPDAPGRGWVGAVLPEMVARIAGARLTTLGGTGHMMIFEAPLTCRGLVLDVIAGRA
jgi:pimeloyl-ACP methyl ester carboxylesterase